MKPYGPSHLTVQGKAAWRLRRNAVFYMKTERMKTERMKTECGDVHDDIHSFIVSDGEPINGNDLMDVAATLIRNSCDLAGLPMLIGASSPVYTDDGSGDNCENNDEEDEDDGDYTEHDEVEEDEEDYTDDDEDEDINGDVNTQVKDKSNTQIFRAELTESTNSSENESMRHMVVPQSFSSNSRIKSKIKRKRKLPKNIKSTSKPKHKRRKMNKNEEIAIDLTISDEDGLNTNSNQVDSQKLNKKKKNHHHHHGGHENKKRRKKQNEEDSDEDELDTNMNQVGIREVTKKKKHRHRHHHHGEHEKKKKKKEKHRKKKRKKKNSQNAVDKAGNPMIGPVARLVQKEQKQIYLIQIDLDKLPKCKLDYTGEENDKEMIYGAWSAQVKNEYGLDEFDRYLCPFDGCDTDHATLGNLVRHVYGSAEHGNMVKCKYCNKKVAATYLADHVARSHSIIN